MWRKTNERKNREKETYFINRSCGLTGCSGDSSFDPYDAHADHRRYDPKAVGQHVNTINSYDPLGEPMEGEKDNGQYIITEIKYSENYPNSFLDITYPDENRETARPTLIYFHGGGFFGGSTKTVSECRPCAFRTGSDNWHHSSRT